jgi:hypothetical protein
MVKGDWNYSDIVKAYKHKIRHTHLKKKVTCKEVATDDGFSGYPTGNNQRIQIMSTLVPMQNNIIELGLARLYRLAEC